MMMKVRRAVLVLVVLALFSAGCSSDKKKEEVNSGAGTASTVAGASDFSPVSADALTVGTNLPAPGFWNGDDPSSITGGYEYGLAQAVAKRLGLSKGVKVANVSFDALVAGQAKGFDIALSQVTITADRAKVVDFSTPYFSADLGIMVIKGTKVPDVAAAKKLQWAVQQSTTSQTFLTDKVKPDKEPRVYGETTQAFTALQAKQVDAVLLDTSIVLGQAGQPGSPFAVVGQFRTGESYGAILPKGSKNKPAIDKAIKALKADGTLDELIAKYLAPVFKGDPTKVPYIKVP